MIDWMLRTVLVRPLARLVAWIWPPLPRRGDVVLRMRLAGRLLESVPRALPWLPVSASGVTDVVGLLYAAAREPRVVGLRVDVGSLEAGMARIQEVRRALHAVRQAGKHVHVNLEAGGTRQYLVACAADRLTLPPATSLDLVGMRSEVSYLGGVAASLGVHADFEAVGDYKAFAERFVRTGPTSAARENAHEMLHDVWEQLVQAVAAGRGLDVERARELLGRGPYGAAEAVERGLADGLAYPDEVRKQIKEVVGKHRTVKAKRFGARLRRLQRWRWRATRPPLVAVITATGQVMPGSGGAQGNVIAPRPMARMLHAVRKDPMVEAVVLRIDSPGGSAEASDLIWRSVRRLADDKPVVASMGDVAASGGYYIAMGAHQVLAQPATLTGSIGVVGGKLNLGGLYEKLGVYREVIGVGEHNGFYSSGQDFEPAQRARLRERMEEFYRIFVGKAADCRSLDYDELEQHARGRVWTGRQALDRNLVDGLGGVHDAIRLASELAGYDAPLMAVQVAPPSPPLWSPMRWLGSAQAWLGRRFPALGWLLQPALRQGGVVAQLPFEIRIR